MDVIVNDNGEETTVTEAITASISKIIDLDVVMDEDSPNKSISNTDKTSTNKSRMDKMFE